MVSALDSGLSGPGLIPGLETLCCVLGQDTLLSQCPTPPGDKPCGGSRNTPSHFNCYRNWDKPLA